jgi:hypothetical protein
MIDTKEMVMPVAPAYGNGNNGFFGGDGAWIILLLLLGWGNNGNGFGGNGNNNLFPWMNQSNQISNGFQNAAMGDQLTAIQSAINDLGVANLQQSFNVQTAMCQGFNGVQSQLANCCCENRLASADLKYTIATENCADRQAIADGIQKIMDKLCDQELQAERRENANLRTQLNMASLAASQTAQTAQILADNSRQTTALEQYLNPVPIPAYVVQNPNCCQQSGCGCGSF